MSNESEVQARKQVEKIRWLMENLEAVIEAQEEEKTDEVREKILNDPLSVDFKCDWTPFNLIGAERTEMSKIRIVLCTGGPHVELQSEFDPETGDVDERTIEILNQDWFEPMKKGALMGPKEEVYVKAYIETFTEIYANCYR